MHRSFGDFFSNDLTDEGLAPGFEHTFHQKFMQMALLSDHPNVNCVSGLDYDCYPNVDCTSGRSQ